MSAVSGCCWPMYQIHLNRQKTEWTEPRSYSSDRKQTKSTCQLSSQTLIKKSLFSSSSPLFFYLSFKQMSVWIFFSFSKNNCIYYLDKTKTGQRLQRYSAYISGLQVKSTDTATCRTHYHYQLTYLMTVVLFTEEVLLFPSNLHFYQLSLFTLFTVPLLHCKPFPFNRHNYF